jgi:hypothetical protein
VFASVTSGSILLTLKALDAYNDAYPWYATTSCGVTSDRVSQEAPFSAEEFFDVQPFVLHDGRDTESGLKKQREAWEHYEAMRRLAKKSKAVTSRRGTDHEIHHTLDSEFPGVHWSFDRIGPFSSEGGYSWQQMYGEGIMDIQEHVTPGTEVTILSGAIYVVDANDKPIPYPPIHLHHAHIFPYSNRESFKKLVPSADLYNRSSGSGAAWADGHLVLFQSHGDTACTEERGGDACFLRSAPDGHGYRVKDFKGLECDFGVNDVRHSGARKQEWYVQTAVSWTVDGDLPPATFMQFQNPVMLVDEVNGIRSTYKFRRDKVRAQASGASAKEGDWLQVAHSRPNSCSPSLSRQGVVTWFNFTNADLGNGLIQASDLIIHGHQSQLDSWWLFKGRDTYGALERLRHEAYPGGSLPLSVPGSRAELTNLKERVAGAIKSAARGGGDAELLCEVRVPSMVCRKNAELVVTLGMADIKEMMWDRRADIRCREGDIRLDEGETLVVVVFNLAEDIGKSVDMAWEGLEDKSPEMLADQILLQHTIFRADFVRDDAPSVPWSTGTADGDIERGIFAPPVRWQYSSWPDGKIVAQYKELPD